MMALVWKKFGPANYYALTREGGKYTVDRLSQSWMANFLPTGNAENGRVRLTPDSRQGSLSDMKNICEAHSLGLRHELA